LPQPEPTHRAISRLCDILNSFNDQQPSLTLSEISARISLPVSTTHRLLEALVQQQLLLREPNSKKYQLGYPLIHWGTLAQKSINIRNLSLPILQSLSRETGENAVLSVRHGSMSIWLEVVESPHPVGIATRVGKPLSLHAGASSKVLWAFLPDEEMEDLFQVVTLEPMMPNTITDAGTMRHELDGIRARGYAISYEETDPGAMGVAAPVFDHLDQVVAGVGLVAPVSRIPRQDVETAAQAVLKASRELTQRLGGSLPLPFHGNDGSSNDLLHPQLIAQGGRY
jgi:DNA-binding IclR family transcriptional regulator